MKTSSSQGVTALVRETAMGLGHVIGQQLRLAQLEVTAELHAISGRARLLAVLATLIAIGYSLAMAGLAVVIGDRATVGIPLVIIGLVHVVGAGVGLILAPRCVRGSHVVENTTAANTRSHPALDGTTNPAHTPPVLLSLEKTHAQ